MEGELLGEKKVRAGSKPTHPLPLKSGASWCPLGHRSLISLSCGFPCPPGQPCPLQGWGLRRGCWGGVTKGLHSPPSSSTNVDEVVSQGSWEAHFLFRPQDFPRQAPPRGEGHMSVILAPPHCCSSRGPLTNSKKPPEAWVPPQAKLLLHKTPLDR